MSIVHTVEGDAKNGEFGAVSSDLHPNRKRRQAASLVEPYTKKSKRDSHHAPCSDSKGAQDLAMYKVPEGTISHLLANFSAEIEQELDELIETFREAEDHCLTSRNWYKRFDRTVIMQERTIPATPLLLARLPQELVDEVVNYLEPADAICLARASATLLTRVDYLPGDLRRLEVYATHILHKGGYNYNVGHHKLRCLINTERKRLRDRLNVERLNTLAREEASFDKNSTDRSLACCLCLELHESDCFSPQQRDLHPRKRVCRLSELQIPVCSHVSLDLKSVQEAAEEMRCANNGPSTWACENSIHEEHDALEMLPCFDGTAVFRRYRLVRQSTDQFDVACRRSCIERHKDLAICCHSKLGDRAIAEMLTREDYLSTNVTCPTCPCSFSLHVEPHFGHGYVLQLGVCEHIREVFGAPFRRGFLCHFEGGVEYYREHSARMSLKSNSCDSD